MAMANLTPAMIFLAQALLQTVRGCLFGWVTPQTEPTVTPTAGEALEDISGVAPSAVAWWEHRGGHSKMNPHGPEDFSSCWKLS